MIFPHEKRPYRQLLIFIIAGATIELLFIAILSFPRETLSTADVSIYSIMYTALIAFTSGGLYLLTLFLSYKKGTLYHTVHDRQAHLLLIVIIVFGILFRLTCLPAWFELSTDIHRYHWDGMVLFHGINPYQYVPTKIHAMLIKSHPNLTDHITQLLHTIKQHENSLPVYPPFAIVCNTIGYALAPNSTIFIGHRLLYCCADIILLFVLAAQLQRRDQPIWWLFLYAWNPLTFTELVGSAHIDGIMLLWWILALAQFFEKRPLLSGIFVGMACLTKYIGLLALPLLFFEYEKKHRLLFLTGTIGTILLGYIPFIHAGWGVIATVRDYYHWNQFNGSIYKLLCITGLSPMGAKYIGLTLFAGLFSWIMIKRIKPIRATIMLLIGYYLVTPTVHQWYIVWALPFICFEIWYSVIVFSISILIQYGILWKYYYSNHTEWTENPLRWALTYIPFFIFLSIDIYRYFIRKKTPLKNQ